METLIKFAKEHTRSVRYVISESNNSFIYLSTTLILIKFTDIFDFQTKTSYFYAHLLPKSRAAESSVEIDRANIFEDSYSFLHRLKKEDFYNRFVVHFKGEQGQDEGGLLREWYQILSLEIFNPDYALFILSSSN